MTDPDPTLPIAASGSLPPTSPPPTSPPVVPTAAGATSADPTTAHRPPLLLDRAGVALGVALLSAAVVVSTFYSRAEGDLDASVFAVGVLATLALLGIAGAAIALSDDRGRSSDLAGWPGAFGAVGAGLVVAVLLDDSEATAYVAGLLVVALSVGGYVVTRRAAFVVSTIAGAFVVYLQLCSDVIDLGGDGENSGITAAAVLLVFAVLVTAAGWPLPTRVLSGVVVGVLTVVGFAAVLITISVVGVFTTFGESFDEGTVSSGPVDTFHNDAWVILVFALFLVLGWALCASLTDHVGFRILEVAMAVTVVPLAMVLLVVEHPTYWEVVLGGAGGLVLLGAGGLVLLGVGARSLDLPARRTGQDVTH